MRTLLTDLRGNPIPIADRHSIRLRRPQKPPLMRFVEMQAWQDVIRRAKSHAQEIWQIDEQGNTPLHLACKFDPPVSVIQALGAAISASNVNGLTPLHVAASHRCNAKTLKMLVDLRPASLRTPSRRERTPMHYACLSFRGLDFDAFETLLVASFVVQNRCMIADDEDDDAYDDISNDEIDNDHFKHGVVMTWKDSTGSTPLGLLFRRYRERVKSAICQMSQNVQPKEDIMLQSDLGQLWGKARLIVAKLTEERLQREGSSSMMPLDHQSDDEEEEDDSSLAWAVQHHLLGERKFRIVHASVGLVGYGCPPELIRLAIAIHPQQVREMDEDGNLPIHIAVTASSSGGSSSVDKNDHTSNNGGGSGVDDDSSSVYSLTSFFSNSAINATPHSFDKVIQILLRVYPESAHIPHGKSGRLPLNLAIRAGYRTWEDGIQTLLEANPTALHGAKLQKAYPEGLALIGGGGRPPPSAARRSGRGLVEKKTKGKLPEGGLRMFQNLYLLALHNRSSHSNVVGGRRGTTTRTTRNHRASRNSSPPSSKILKTTIPPNPRNLTIMYELLRSKPDLVDPDKHNDIF